MENQTARARSGLAALFTDGSKMAGVVLEALASAEFRASAGRDWAAADEG